MRVLVYCPLSPNPPRLYARALTFQFEQDWPEPYELLYGVSTNATDLEADMVGKLERARRLAVSGKFDALFVVGYDIQVPKDALKRLSAIEADIVYGLTVGPEWPFTWYAWDSGAGVSDLTPAMGKELWDQVVETKSINLNCALIRRKVLERFKFRSPLAPTFAKSCLPFTQKIDMGCVCGRILYADGGKIVWPDADEDALVRVEYLSPQRAPATVPYSKTILAREAA